LFFTLLAQKQWPTTNNQQATDNCQQPISLSFSFWLCSEEKKSGQQKPKSRRRISGQKSWLAANALCAAKKKANTSSIRFY